MGYTQNGSHYRVQRLITFSVTSIVNRLTHYDPLELFLERDIGSSSIGWSCNYRSFRLSIQVGGNFEGQGYPYIFLAYRTLDYFLARDGGGSADERFRLKQRPNFG